MLLYRRAFLRSVSVVPLRLARERKYEEVEDDAVRVPRSTEYREVRWKSGSRSGDFLLYGSEREPHVVRLPPVPRVLRSTINDKCVSTERN